MPATPERPAGATDWRAWVPAGIRRFLPGGAEDAPADAASWQHFVPEAWRSWLDASPAPRPQGRTLRFVGLDEERPGPVWRALFDETWHAYRSWWVGGSGVRPTRAQAEAALREHMPELVDVHRELVALAGDDDTAAALLTLWDPPPFIVACSQAVVPDARTGEPVLARNYDYDPRLFEATVARTRWGTRRVIGTGDCLWGLVDGVNDAGLAISLTFGGRREVGVGFGIPLVMRYVLETCDDVAQGVAVLERLPHQLSYNVTLCDTSGAVATVAIAPDRPARVTTTPRSTNHPATVEWPEHSAFVKSVERLDALAGLQAAGADGDELVAAMLEPPFLARDWDAGFATLFTAVYRPASGTLAYHWPGRRVDLALDRPLPESFTVTLAETEPVAAVSDPPAADKTSG